MTRQFHGIDALGLLVIPRVSALPPVAKKAQIVYLELTQKLYFGLANGDWRELEDSPTGGVDALLQDGTRPLFSGSVGVQVDWDADPLDDGHTIRTSQFIASAPLGTPPLEVEASTTQVNLFTSQYVGDANLSDANGPLPVAEDQFIRNDKYSPNNTIGGFDSVKLTLEPSATDISGDGVQFEIAKTATKYFQLSQSGSMVWGTTGNSSLAYSPSGILAFLASSEIRHQMSGGGSFRIGPSWELFVDTFNGKVGILESNPQEPLSVRHKAVGGAKPWVSLNSNIGSQLWLIQNTGSGEFEVYDKLNSTSKLYVQSGTSGVVGVNTGASVQTGATFHIRKTNADVILRLDTKESSPSSAWHLRAVNSNGNFRIDDARTSITPRLLIDSSGKVGINTATPLTAKLYVLTDSNGEGLYIHNNAVDVDARLRLGNADRTWGVDVYGGVAGRDDFRIRDLTTNSNRIVIRSDNGYVGLNQTVPAEPAHVGGNLRIDGALKPNGDPGVALQILASMGDDDAPEWLTLGVGAGKIGDHDWEIGADGGSDVTGHIYHTGLVTIGNSTANREVESGVPANLELTDDFGGALSLRRDDGEITSGQVLGSIGFTTSLLDKLGAKISAQAGGDWDTGDTPGKLLFYTTALSTDYGVLRLEVTSEGQGKFYRGLVVNENGGNGADVDDVRMESGSNSALFFLDASENRLGFGTNTPAYFADIRGDVSFGENTSVPTTSQTYLRFNPSPTNNNLSYSHTSDSDTLGLEVGGTSIFSLYRSTTRSPYISIGNGDADVADSSDPLSSLKVYIGSNNILDAKLNIAYDGDCVPDPAASSGSTQQFALLLARQSDSPVGKGPGIGFISVNPGETSPDEPGAVIAFEATTSSGDGSAGKLHFKTKSTSSSGTLKTVLSLHEDGDVSLGKPSGGGSFTPLGQLHIQNDTAEESALYVENPTVSTSGPSITIIDQFTNPGVGERFRPALQLKNDVVSHGITDWADDNAYGHIGAFSESGGLLLDGFLDGAGNDIRNHAVVIRGIVTNNPDVNTPTGTITNETNIALLATKKSGTSDGALPTGDYNAVQIWNGGAPIFAFQTNGELYAYQGASWTGPLDDYDDLELMKAAEAVHLRGTGESSDLRVDFQEALAKNEKVLLKEKLIAKSPDGKSVYTSVTGMQRLYYGAFRQLKSMYDEALDRISRLEQQLQRG